MSRAVIPLLCPIESRDGLLDSNNLPSSDSFSLNTFAEKSSSTPYLCRRPSKVKYATAPGSGATLGYVMYGSLPYAIIGNNLYRGLTGLLAPATYAIPTLGAGSTERMSCVSSSNALPSVFKNSSAAWYFNGAAVTKVADPDYPATTLPGLALLDGTYYVMEAVSGAIRGSALNDITSWDALNTIQTAGLANPTGLYKHLNYIIGIYSNGLQFYYDAGNPTGSPLAPVSNASFTIGSQYPNTFATASDSTFFIGSPDNSGVRLYRIQGVSVSPISPEPLNRLLTNLSQWFYGASTSTVTATILNSAGHSFYLITFPGYLTLAFDIDTGFTSIWSFWDNISTLQTPFDISFTMPDGRSGTEVILGSTDATLYTMSIADASDTNSSGSQFAIKVIIQTPLQNISTVKRKFIRATYLQADDAAETATLSHTDDDYATFSTPRTISLSGEWKKLIQCGSARRRAYRLDYSGVSFMRFQGIEVEVDEGEA